MPLVLCIGFDSHVISSTFYSKTDLLCSTIPHFKSYCAQWPTRYAQTMSHYAQIMSHHACVMYNSHARLSYWGGQVNFLGRASRNCLAWSTHIHIPAYCATYGYSQTCHVQKVSCLSSEWVWYIHAAYTTFSWPAALTLRASLAVLMTWFASSNTHLSADTVNWDVDSQQTHSRIS